MINLYLQRITITGIRNDEWFKKNYTPVRLYEDEDITLDDIHAVFEDSEVYICISKNSINISLCFEKIKRY